jgi:phosphatidylglycerol---prolipoprotein diacylglyceryl transferase
MLPILQIGPLAMQTPGLILILGLWVGLTLAEKLAPRYQINPNDIYNLVFNALIAGVIGARIIFVIRYIDIFRATPLNLISLNPGLLDPLGGLGVGFLIALIYGNRKNLPLWSTLDALTPILAVFAVAISLANFASGDAFGIETQVPWGILLWGAKRHPVQIYETLGASFILTIIWFSKYGKNLTSRGPGITFVTFLVMSASVRMFLEAFRGDSLILLGNIRTFQVLAWVVLATSLGSFIKLSISNIDPT